MGFAYYCYFVTDEISRHDSAGSETALDKVYSTWSARLKVTWKPTIFFDQNWIENNLVTKIWILLIRATIFFKRFFKSCFKRKNQQSYICTKTTRSITIVPKTQWKLFVLSFNKKSGISSIKKVYLNDCEMNPEMNPIKLVFYFSM